MRFSMAAICSAAILSIFSGQLPAAELKEVIRDGIHYVIGAEEIPAKVFNSRQTPPALPVERPFISATNFVPLGIYGGDWGDATWNYILSDLQKHNCNTFYINGSGNKPYPPSKVDSRNFAGLKKFLYQADKWNIRLYYQNQGSPLRWPARKKIQCDRDQRYNTITGWLKQHLPEIRKDQALRRALLAWGPSEELDMATAEDARLGKINALSGKLDPYHPMIILLKAVSIEEQRALYKNIGALPVILPDPYYIWRPFGWNEMVNWELGILKQWSDLAYAHNSRFWLCNPCFTEGICARYDDSKYKYGGYRMSSPQMIRAGQWLGLANGASGFYLFVHYDYHPMGRACLTRLDWQPTEEYVAVSRFFRKVERISPLVAGWKRTKLDITLPEVRGTFRHPDFKGNFTVIVNADMRDTRTFPIDSQYVELEEFKKIKTGIELMPGEGAILFSGGKDEVSRLKGLLNEQEGMVNKSLDADTMQVWKVDDHGVSFAAEDKLKIPAILGGKGGIPKFYITKMPGEKEMKIYCSMGKILDWGNGVKVPANPYHPPYPGAGENALFIHWPDKEIKHISYLEKAYFELEFDKPFDAGRLAIYPVVDNGLGFAGKTEYMPRWEMEGRDYNSGKLIIEITGIVQDWIKGDLINKGMIIVYNNWPDGSDKMEIKHISKLHLKYRRAGGGSHSRPACQPAVTR